MPRPNITDQEITAIVNLVMETGEEKVTLPEASILPLLHEDDQTPDRVTKLLKDELSTKGIKVRKSGNGFVFRATTMAPVSSPNIINEVSKETGAVDPKQWATRLDHEYMTPRIIYSDVMIAIQNNCIPLLIGPPGCGKSIMLEQIAIDLGIPFKRISLNGVVDPADIIGDIQIISDGNGGTVTKYTYGILTEAVEKGHMVIFDEVDTMHPMTNGIFQRITESDGQLVIKTEVGSKIIQKHPQYRVAYTANTDGYGDHTGMFAGAQVQNAAFLDRISIRFKVDYSPVTEHTILEENYKLPSGVLKALYGNDPTDPNNLVNTIRARCADSNGWNAFLTMRTIMEIGKNYKSYHGPGVGEFANCTMSWHKTMLYCFVLAFPSIYQEDVKTLIRQMVGVEFSPTNDEDEIISPSVKKALKDKGFFPLADSFVPKQLGE